tara:strand:- start:14 stop:160 length:147 start_codon:yes stop_codon:yes gene_type:complete
MEYLILPLTMGILAVYTVVIYRLGHTFGRLEASMEDFVESTRKILDKE